MSEANIYQCAAAICVKEREFIQPYVFRCLKHKDHSGDHYALDPAFSWTLRRIDGTKIIWTGRAEFLWSAPDVNVFRGPGPRDGMVVIEDVQTSGVRRSEDTETVTRPADLTIWEYGADDPFELLQDGDTEH